MRNLAKMRDKMLSWAQALLPGVCEPEKQQARQDLESRQNKLTEELNLMRREILVEEELRRWEHAHRDT